ncbi:MAG: penicillin-binding protein 2 [Actinomycetota bacterium]
MSTRGTDGTRLRVAILAAVLFSFTSILILRLYFLQVLSYKDYAAAAKQNQVRVVSIQPARGNILDRNGEILVTRRPSGAVSIRPDELIDRAGTISRLASLLGVETRVIEARLADKTVLPYTPIPVADDVNEDKLVYIKEHQDEFTGVVIETRPVRIYPKAQLASHLLGYVGEVNAEQLAQPRYKGRRPGSIVGRSGIEYAYENELYGKEGLVKLEVDSSGRVRKELGSRPPKVGSDVVTTIDSRIQTLVEESLAQGIESARSVYDEELRKRYLAPAGGAVVLDPTNGEIIAMASYPTYDPSSFVGGISKNDFGLLANDPANPLLNRVTQARFPPGSVFKIVTAAAALQEGIAQPGGRYNCPGSYRFADTTFRNWKTTDSGIINVPQSLIDSCDTVFYDWGAEFYRRFRKGAGERLQDYARAFGFGRTTGIEIPFETTGRVPDEGWLKEQNREHPRLFPYSTWLPGYTINMSIGQGDVLTTPLQTANSYAAIANGGPIFQPHVGLRVMDGKRVARKIEPKLIRNLQLSPQNLSAIRQGLLGVTSDGTAKGAFAGFPLAQVPIAAKTGTAQLQQIPPKQPYAWFVAYAPANGPKYVVAVMLEEGGHGGETAAPIARRIIEGLFNLPLSQITVAARTD